MSDHHYSGVSTYLDGSISVHSDDYEKVKSVDIKKEEVPEFLRDLVEGIGAPLFNLTPEDLANILNWFDLSVEELTDIYSQGAISREELEEIKSKWIATRQKLNPSVSL